MVRRYLMSENHRDVIGQARQATGERENARFEMRSEVRPKSPDVYWFETPRTRCRGGPARGCA